MTEGQFRDWMSQLAEASASESEAHAQTIWWRAQIRQRQESARRAIRPIRIAEAAAGLVCWILAGVVAAEIGPNGLGAFLVLTIISAISVKTATPGRV
jgi:hypothetical protein